MATAGAPGPIPPDALVIPLARTSLATAPIELAGPWHQAPGDLTRDQALGGRTTAPPWQVLDDTAWAPQTRPPRWSGVGWFRLELEVDPDLVGHPLALAVEHPGASEIFLDGQALTRFGTVADETEEERPYDPQGEPVPIVFSTPGRHTLVLRYSSTAVRDEALATWLTLDRGGGFRLRLDRLDRAITGALDERTKILLLNVAGAALALGFAMLHLLVFLFHPRHRGNLWFACFAFCLAANGGLESLLHFAHLGLWGTTLLRLANLFAAGGLLASLLYFLSALRPEPPVGIHWLAATFVPVALCSRVPSLVALFAPLVTLWFLAALVVSLGLAAETLRRRVDGARALALSGMGWVVLAITETSKHLGWFGLRGELIGFWIALLLIFAGGSIFLARRIAREGQELEALALRLEDRVAARTAELRQSEGRALAASQAKSTFLATMSHEIRTPMNAITGLAELLATSDLPTAARRQAATLHRSAISMLALIDEVLDLSRIEAGHLQITPLPFDPRTLAQETLDLFATQAEAKGLRLELVLSAELPTRLFADRARLRQILVNLLGNACKFTTTGAVGLVIEWHEGRLRVAVHDTGIGIAEENLGQLFEPFFQVDGTSQRQYQGSGLGLSICRRLATAMEGTLDVTSTPGEGSTFTLEIPAPLADGPEPVEAEETRKVRGAAVHSPVPAKTPEPAPPDVAVDETTSPDTRLENASGLRILLAEDNPVNQLVTQLMLERLGHRSELVERGPEVLRTLERAPFDVVLLDLHMPGMDGLEVARRIRSRSDLPQPYLVAFTASVLEEDRARCRLAGMDAFLSKPAQLAHLAGILDDVWGSESGPIGDAPSSQ